MFIDYRESSSISGVVKQHNIMVFIGNGFDIAVLKKYRNDQLVSSYMKFYDFLCYKGFNRNNRLFYKMGEDRDLGKENWSDFERSLGELLRERESTESLENDLKEIQDMFLLFLNDIVTPEILLKISTEAEQNKWSIEALSKFLGDLSEADYRKISFPRETNHYHMYNYLFVNLNYTSIFDNYIYLDKMQFDPHKHATVDTNFSFHPDPNRSIMSWGANETVWSSFIMTNTIHPHGYQNIPRSLLFGIEEKDYTRSRTLNKFNKSYWAQNNQRYGKYFEETRLFIIYGTSLGETDSWWWTEICKSLLNTASELIIYYYADGMYDKESIKDRFIKACNVEIMGDDLLIVKDKIYVIVYDDSSAYKMFDLSCKEQEIVEWS